MGLRAVDRIAERNRLSGVYGPLYRLFTVKNKVYNTAVELTAGARWTPPRFSIGTGLTESSQSLSRRC